MLQRDKILEAWKRHSEKRFPTPQFRKAQEFFEFMEANPDICWDELAVEFRENYYDAFDEIVPVLLDTDDPLIIYNCIKFADMDSPQEIEAAKRVIRDSDPEKHQVTMRVMTDVQDLHTELKHKAGLTAPVRMALSRKVEPESKKDPGMAKKDKPKSKPRRKPMPEPGPEPDNQ